MLKKTWILFLGLIVCIGSACVTPTHASSASSVVIVRVQASGQHGPKDELVVLYNNTNASVNISGWCLTNKSNIEFICFNSLDASTALYLEPHSYVVAASQNFVDSNAANLIDIPFIYPVTSQSSGSIVNSNDVVSLINDTKGTVDSYSWTTPIPAGKIVSRNKSLTVQGTYEVSGALLDWSFESPTEVPVSTLIEVVVVATVHPEIVELLPNPIGGDAGNEYIEIFNPNDTPLDMSNYRLRIGANLEKSLSFPEGTVIGPLEYKAFSNNEIKFTLTNTVSAVQIEQDGLLLGNRISYDSPPEGSSYATFDGSWSFTTIPTPGAPNEMYTAIEQNYKSELGLTGPATDESTKATASSGSALKPCAANQYRNPQTNRCRVIIPAATNSSSQVPCAANQYRSSETNRCRNLTSGTTGPTPCKEGQERNPQTNRCRSIAAMSTVDHAVKGVSTDSTATGSKWYWWLAIGGVVFLILSYAVWEWREELGKAWVGIKAKFARNQK